MGEPCGRVVTLGGRLRTLRWSFVDAVWAQRGRIGAICIEACEGQTAYSNCVRHFGVNRLLQTGLVEIDVAVIDGKQCVAAVWGVNGVNVQLEVEAAVL